MEKKSSINARISSSMEVSVISAGPEYNLADSLWAINWFDLRYPWMYDLYNKIVFSHVMKVGAKPLLKARLIKKIIGTDQDARQMLLIVNYPNAEQFIRMIQSKLFQLKSILRVSSVLNFTFGFMKRTDQKQDNSRRQSEYTGKLFYLVHHYQYSDKKGTTDELESTARGFDVFTKFIGEKAALIGRKKNNDKLRTAPFIMDGLCVFAAFEQKQFDQLIESEAYKSFMSGNKSNFVGVFEKIF